VLNLGGAKIPLKYKGRQLPVTWVALSDMWLQLLTLLFSVLALNAEIPA
jgi:hypothetical protein